MNIHADHGPNCTVEPEYFHTCESINLLLDRLSDRGFAVFEEIILNDRSGYAFLKFMNTILEAYRERGEKEPLKNIVAYKWDWGPPNLFRTVVIKRKAFTPEENSLMTNYFSCMKKSQKWDELLLFPGKKTGSSLENYLLSTNRKTFHIHPPLFPQAGSNRFHSQDNKYDKPDVGSQVIQAVERQRPLLYEFCESQIFHV